MSLCQSITLYCWIICIWTAVWSNSVVTDQSPPKKQCDQGLFKNICVNNYTIFRENLNRSSKLIEFFFSICFPVVNQTNTLAWFSLALYVPKMWIVKFAKSLDPDEAAFNEPPEMDLHELPSMNSQYEALMIFFYKTCSSKVCSLRVRNYWGV